MAKELNFVWLSKRARLILIVVSLILSALPASFLYATSSTGASIAHIGIVESSYAVAEEVPLKVLQGDTLPEFGGVEVVITSATGGEFAGANLSGECNDTFGPGPFNSNIASNANQKAFCYRNANVGQDTITAVFTMGTTTEIATLDILIAALVDVPVPDPVPELYVNICQATDDINNPFDQLSVSAALILKSDPSISNEDIIPPFDGFLGQNWNMVGQAIHANQCNPVVVDADPIVLCTVTIVSDDKNTVVEKAGAYATPVSWIHPLWTALVSSSSVWIWGEDPVVNPVSDTTYTFENKFGWNGPVTSASLRIAADNSYTSQINSVLAGVDNAEFNYEAAGVDVHDVTPLIAQGNNKLSVTVKNWAMNNGTTQTNPAGLKYELVVTGTGENCDIPYVEETQTTSVTMCKYDDNGNPLPDWNLLLDPSLINNQNQVKAKRLAGFSGTTGVDGCVTFSSVPLGNYEIDEVMKDGWENVSGLSEVTINSRENRFEIVNRPTDTDHGQPPVLACGAVKNLMVNSSFESPVVTDSALWERFSSVLGWSINKVSNGASTTLELHRGWSSNEAADGEQYAELDGDHATLISQTVATIPGETYILDWYFAPRQLVASDQNQLTVLVNDSQVAQTDPTAGMGTLSVSDWELGTTTFTAVSSSTKISFKNEGPSDSFGTFLDDVNLRCIPGNDEDDEDDNDDTDNATTTPPVVDPDDGDNGGSSSSGTRAGYRGGRVAGVSTSTVSDLGNGGDYPLIGAVLGDQISVVPYGAPNAGHGGASNTNLPFWSLALGLCFLALFRQFKLS